MSAALGNSIGRKYCKALGLDPSRVAGLDVSIKTDDVVLVNVTMYPSMEQLDGCVKHLESQPKRKIKIVYSCSDHCHHQNKYKAVAWCCGKTQQILYYGKQIIQAMRKRWL